MSRLRQDSKFRLTGATEKKELVEQSRPQSAGSDRAWDQLLLDAGLKDAVPFQLRFLLAELIFAHSPCLPRTGSIAGGARLGRSPSRSLARTRSHHLRHRIPSFANAADDASLKRQLQFLLVRQCKTRRGRTFRVVQHRK